LVLPASVTTVPDCRWGSIAFRIGAVCATGAAINTKSVSRNASAIEVLMMSMMPNCLARSSEAMVRPDSHHALDRTGFFKRQSERAAD